MNEDNMRDILNEIYTAHPKWYYIGLQLNVPSYTLDGIKSDPTLVRLEKVIRYWLTHMNPRPTWGDLVNALRKSTVGESRLAGEIERKFCCREQARAVNGSKDAGEREIALKLVLALLTSQLTCMTVLRAGRNGL